MSQRPSIWPRSVEIALASLGFAWAWLRLRHRAPEELPPRLRRTLEGLGTTFVKLGQGLSLRRDVLPANYREELSHLHEHVPAFDADRAAGIVVAAFGQPVESLFASFEREPFAAASVAQVHRARRPDGVEVAVKIRRPGIVHQVTTDLRLLRRTARFAESIVPGLRRLHAQALIDELSRQLLDEIDLLHEARNARRLHASLDGDPTVTLPRVVEPLATADVLVQEYSHGASISQAFGTPRGRLLAPQLLDAYLRQLFIRGVFHGDPHPGNLFVMDDGRLCFHDFGTVGYLDPASRRALALLVEAMSYGDAEGALDAALALGFLRAPLDRHEFARAISAILEELGALPLAEWSLAETLWRIARLGQGDRFRLPPHLLVLLRTLFLAENTLRSLDPEFDVLAAFVARREVIAQGLEAHMDGSRRPLPQRLIRTAKLLPELAADLLRQAQAEDGRVGLAMHHRGLEELELHLGRTGNRLSLALVTLGLYIAGSLLMLHSAGPRVFGDMPLFALLAYGAALALSVQLVVAISRSGRL